MRKLMLFLLFLAPILVFSQIDTLNYTTVYIKGQPNKCNVYITAEPNQVEQTVTFKVYRKPTNELLKTFRANYYYRLSDNSIRYQAVDLKGYYYTIHVPESGGEEGIIFQNCMSEQTVMYLNEERIVMPKQKI